MKRWALVLATLVLGSAPLAAQGLAIYTENSPPYNYLGSDGKPKGLAYDVVVELQKRVGNSDPIKFVPWARGLDELDTKANVLLFATNRTAERNPRYQWIGPVGENAFTFYVKADSKVTISSLEDAKKAGQIGVYLNDVREQILKSKGFTNLDESNDVLTTVRKLMAGRIAVLAGSPDETSELIVQAGFKMDDIKPLYVFQRTQVFIAASKDLNPAVLKAWQGAFDAMVKDGTFARIHGKYLPNSPLPGPAITKF